MNTQITPVNITAAALITQFSIIIILYIGLIILRKDDEPKSIFLKKPDSIFFLLLLGFALITIGCLVFSDEFSNVWKPLFREITFGGINWSTSLIIVFYLDIILITIFVAMTGGSALSAFSPIYFIIPALALFLRESLGRIISYLIFITVLFSFNLVFFNNPDNYKYSPRRRFAYWCVSVLCFILATLIGYLTRPQ